MQRREKEMRDRELVSKNPSFSSILLDEIYQSMANDEMDLDKREASALRKVDGSKFFVKLREEEENKEVLSLRRACLIEKWMDQKIRDKITSQRSKNHLTSDKYLDRNSMFLCSSSSSSDTSSGGLSSSDNESFRRAKAWSSSSFELDKHPKPIRTGLSSKTDKLVSRDGRWDTMPERPSQEDGLIKSKSRALKMYNNLKKVRPPASPGGRLTSFINSLFQAGHAKKHDLTVCEGRKLSDESVCSSASSFSRSCLSKNSPATREMLHKGAKRNVTFVPDGVKSLPKLQNGTNACNHDEFGWGFLKEHRTRCAGPQANGNVKVREDDDCDAASCASSDLFELDHIAAAQRFREELPVYETTKLGFRRSLSNRARV